jgi:hypothetical protein
VAAPFAVERARSSIAVDAPATLCPELGSMKALLMAMSEGRHALFFDFARKTAIHFNGDREKVAQELYEVAGSDPSSMPRCNRR